MRQNNVQCLYYLYYMNWDMYSMGCATLTSSEGPSVGQPLCFTLYYTLYLLYCESFKRQNKVYINIMCCDT